MTTRRYLLTSSAALIFVAFLTYAGTSLAQVNGFPNCSTNTPTVNVNQNAVFTASGGNGSYIWSVDSFNTITNTTGGQFSVSFPASGTYIVHVTSNGQTNSCSVMVVPNNGTNFFPDNSSGTLACLPASQNVSAGQSANLTATGGNGSYSWIIPELSLSNPTGSGSFVTYTTPGTRIVTVMSGGSSATCAINVIGSVYVPAPGLPNTGGGYGRW